MFGSNVKLDYLANIKIDNMFQNNDCSVLTPDLFETQLTEKQKFQNNDCSVLTHIGVTRFGVSRLFQNNDCSVLTSWAIVDLSTTITFQNNDCSVLTHIGVTRFGVSRLFQNNDCSVLTILQIKNKNGENKVSKQ